MSINDAINFKTIADVLTQMSEHQRREGGRGVKYYKTKQ